MKILLGFFTMIFLFASVSLANEALPSKPPKKQAKAIDTTLSIRLDENAKEARLIIPRSQLKQLRAEIDQLDDGSDNSTAAVTFSRRQTIVSGFFLSLAFVFGGVWLSRSGKAATKPGKILAAATVLFLSGAFAMIAFGNAGPPPEARSITGKMFTDAVHMYGFGSGKIKLETSDDRLVTLIVPDPPKEEKSGE
jgi:hypothetical protein